MTNGIRYTEAEYEAILRRQKAQGAPVDAHVHPQASPPQPAPAHATGAPPITEVVGDADDPVASIGLMLPFPPSLNHSGRNSHRAGRKSREYLAFKHDVAAAAIRAGSPKIGGRLRVMMLLSSPHYRRYDIDNRIKGLLDSLQAAGFFEDDWQVDELLVRRLAPSESGFASVELERLDDA